MKTDSSRREFVADSALILFFRSRLISHLKANGYSEVLEIGSPRAGAWECRKGDISIIVNTNPVEGDKERLAVESNTSSLDEIMTAVVKEAAAELIEVFLKPMVKSSTQEIRAEVSACLRELGIPSI